MQISNNSVGVYYDSEAYAGFWQRIAIEIIDVSVIMTISVICTMLVTEIFPPSERLVTALFLLWAGIWFTYFVLLKRSSFGTLGYKLCKTRIVDLSGECPSIVALTFRIMFAVIGPLNVLFDLIWLSGDANRQALRDKFAKTYVIKKDSNPIGTGRLTYSDYYLWGWHVLFCEVKRADNG